VEIKRQKISSQPLGSATLRVEGLNTSQLLRGGDLEGANRPARLEGTELEKYVEERILTTTLDKAVAWGRSNSFFPLGFGLACCALEAPMHVVASRMDIGRFGWEAFRASPRQADLIIIAGRVSIKMAPIIRRIYDQMLEPKWAISMGACCSSMGVFNNYALVPADKFMPIDVHVPGCPPRPEAVVHGVLKLRKLVQDDPEMGWRERYGAVGTEEIVPEVSAGGAQDLAGGAAGAAQPPLPPTPHELTTPHKDPDA
jgi:NADH-quinone oxidoreductase subunit B